MRSTSRAAPSSAFLRSRIGVAPVCASWPVTVPLHTGDDADLTVFSFKDRTLLDVQFKERGERMIAAALIAAIADLIERGTECHAGAILARMSPVAREGASEHAGSNHRGRKARALLVGPVDHLDRRIGLVAGLHKSTECFQRAEHTEHAIKLAAGRLGIEVAPHRDRRNVVPLTRTAREHGPHGVDRDGAAQRLATYAKPVAHLAVEIGEGQTADAALRRAADRAGLHQFAPKPLAVDLEVLHPPSPAF